MSVFAGVDGGGTRTRAVLVDAQGGELGRSDLEGAVVTADRPEDAADAVRRSVREAAEAADVSLPVDVLWAGLAGAGATVRRAAVTRALRKLDLAERLVVGTDVEAAFHDAFGSGPGVMLIAGTGSIVWARDEAGAELRVGGWGRTLGDEGSGYWIGLEGLRYLTRAKDGRCEATTMRDDLLERCDVSSVDGLVSWVEAAPKSAVAALAPLVVARADEGDAGATTIVDAAVGHLRAHLDAAVNALGAAGSARSALDVVLWGGLVAPGGPLEGRMKGALEAMGLTASVKPVDPPMGAARLALASVGG